MKSVLNQQIIDKYILDEFGEISNPPTKDNTIQLIDNDELSLEKVKLWVLFGGDLLIKAKCGKTILHSASLMGQLDIIEYVIDNINISILDEYNDTPLLLASINGQIEVINLLLDRGANINHQNKYGWSALYYACYYKRLKTVKVLVNKGIDIFLKNNNNKTALDVAKYHGYQKIVDYLNPFYNNK